MAHELGAVVVGPGNSGGEIAIDLHDRGARSCPSGSGLHYCADPLWHTSSIDPDQLARAALPARRGEPMRPEDAAADEYVIRLEGTLDGFVARRVEGMLLRATAGARLHLDLTQVREFHDFGIAVLGQALAQTEASVTLRGLRHHQICVLRYFGVETAPLESAIVPDAA